MPAALYTPPSMRHIATLIVLVCALTANAAQKRPNIVFIFSDDHAVQAISALGSKINQTPHIDRLAKEGAIYRNSFCANSICGPSRACILTGKHSHINGFRRNGDFFDGSQGTFPKMVQDAGYETALVGKWHLRSNPTGFNYWEILPGQGNYYNPDLIQMDGKRKRYQGYCTDIITDRALNWLKTDRSKDKPFILMCQHKAPHRNWSPHPRHFDLFKGKPVPEPDSLFDSYAGRTSLLKENEMSVANHMHWGHDMKFNGKNLFPEHFENLPNREYGRMTDEQKKTWDKWYEPRNQKFIAQMKAGKLTEKEIIQWKYQRYITDYLKSVQAVDDGVGRVLDYLDESGLAENTVVIYSSDQGFYLGEHGWYDKRWMYEESLKMPFLIRWPGVINPGSDSPAMIQNIDYAATFLELAGAPIPADIQGRSLVPLFRNGGAKTPDWRDAIYYAYYENAAVHNVPFHDGVRTERYKLMWFPRTREWQLHDLKTDPQEMNSVHADPDYVPVLAALQKRYRDLRKHYDVNSAVIPSTRGNVKSWNNRNQQLTANSRNGPFDVVFVGDSITQGWEGRGKDVWKKYYGDKQALNLGIGGDRTEHVIWRLTANNQMGRRAKVAVVMIGTNNTGHFDQDPDEVAAGVESILDIMKKKRPETKILLLGIFPRGQSPHDLKRLNNIMINQKIRRFADGERVHYMDLSNEFMEPDGTISKTVMPDYLHLNAEGYERWAKAIQPKLAELGL
ncbi:MAG: arylsulfatase A-like enzyme/lysophospholipase L1-like esterase [Limisphaerales bacterium]